MDELIQLVSQKTGLPEDKARSAAETVIQFLKNRLPEPMAAQVDQAIKGGGTADLGNVVKGLGGMFGKKK